MSRAERDGRKPCILFLSCIGAASKYFLQLSDDFRRSYRIVPYLQNNVALLPDMLPAVEDEMRHSCVLLYHEPDSMHLGEQPKHITPQRREPVIKERLILTSIQ